MDENNRKGPGVFYAVIGIATLVVAIIGATFAFFSASDTDVETIQGSTAEIGLQLTVTPVTTSQANGGLIPILETDLEKGLAGDSATENVSCLDKNGNTVCQVYKIDVKNTGNSTVVLKGTLTLNAETIKDLKWTKLNGEKELGENAKNAKEVTNLEDSISVNGSDTHTIYVMVYINETSTEQNTSNNGQFTGIVSYNAADGQGVTASFTAGA